MEHSIARRCSQDPGYGGATNGRTSAPSNVPNALRRDIVKISVETLCMGAGGVPVTTDPFEHSLSRGCSHGQGGGGATNGRGSTLTLVSNALRQKIGIQGARRDQRRRKARFPPFFCSCRPAQGWNPRHHAASNSPARQPSEQPSTNWNTTSNTPKEAETDITLPSDPPTFSQAHQTTSPPASECGCDWPKFLGNQ